MPEFSKTRLIYYENGTNNINKNNYISKTTISSFNEKNANLNYRVCTIEGEDHNWHEVPINTYGLYLSPAELASLYYNFDSFWPEHCKVTVSHAIPLAKYMGTNNSTQLSFNNTIYSLTYVNKDTQHVLTSFKFTSIDDATNFFYSFDGTDWNSSARVVLPKPKVHFKIPAFSKDGKSYNTIKTNEQGLYTVPLQFLKTNTKTISNDDNVINLTDFMLDINMLVGAHLPEFIMDNANVKALYPGENQDIFTHEFPKNKYNIVDCSGPTFNKHFMDNDMRNYGMNSNTFMDLPYLCCMNLSNASVGIAKTSNRGKDQGLQHNSNLWYAHGINIQDFYANLMPSFLIKGVPIVDQSNNLVPHHFLVTITWELSLAGEPVSRHVPRPLQWGYYNIQYKQIIKEIKTNNNVNTPVWESIAVPMYSWPTKQHAPLHWDGSIHMQRTDLQQNKNYFERQIFPPYADIPISATGLSDRNKQVLNDREINPEIFVNNNDSNLPTRTWLISTNLSSASYDNISKNNSSSSSKTR